MTFRYFYDDAGQLIKVVDSSGVLIEYIYDAVGNMLEVRRSTLGPGALSIFSFSPQRAGPLTLVTVVGQGFSSNPSLNIVRFNGVIATVISATPTQLVVQVPVGALPGPISITVGPNSVASSTVFTALAIPVITSVAPSSVVPGSVIANFQVTGANLTGAVLSFLPSAVPPAIIIGSVAINPGGTAATLSLTVGGGASGDFVLVAENSFGISNAFPAAGNTLHVGAAAESVSRLFSILNTASPVPAPPTQREVDSRLISILNTVSPAPAPPTQREVDSRLISILNSASLAPSQLTMRQAVGLLSASRNGGTMPTAPVHAANKPLIRVLNQAVGLIANSVGFSPTPSDPLLDVTAYGPDADGDAIPDRLERLILTDPNEPDTDFDGFPDGIEVVHGSDPREPSSKPILFRSGEVTGPVFSMQNLAAPIAQPDRFK
jgi:YD repeat-containing protein